MTKRLSVGVSSVDLGGSEGAAVVQVAATPEVDWAVFSNDGEAGDSFTEGYFKALSWSELVSKVVGHVNDCMGKRGGGQAVLDLCRSRDDRKRT